MKNEELMGREATCGVIRIIAIIILLLGLPSCEKADEYDRSPRANFCNGSSSKQGT